MLLPVFSAGFKRWIMGLHSVNVLEPTIYTYLCVRRTLGTKSVIHNCLETCYIRQVNVVNGGYTVMLAVVLSFCRSVLPCALSI